MVDSSDMKRWERLLRIPTTTTNELYDEDNGIKQHILRAFGFHDEYLSYASTPATRSVKRLKAAGHNCVSVSRVERGVRGVNNVKILNWNYATFWNQDRLRETTQQDRAHATHIDPFATHARGVFVDRERSLFVVYEPRAYVGTENEWFGWAINNFGQLFKSWEHILIYGNQTNTSDCEKRVIRFGICCWESFRLTYPQRPHRKCPCGLKITHITSLSKREPKSSNTKRY